MGSVTTNTKSLSIIIIGAGIAGLAAATALSRKNHSVIVLESKPTLQEFGASIGITSNGVRPLKVWGLENEFSAVVTRNGGISVRVGETNEIMGFVAHNKRNHAVINYVDEIWNINRKDYQAVLARGAEANGAKILFDAETTGVDVEGCIVHLKDGRQLKADVIVGADGMRSSVRHSIPRTAHAEPVASAETCFRCEVPKDKMRGNPLLEELLTSGDEFAWLGDEGKYVLAWPLPENRNFDIVLCIQRLSNLPPGRWGIRADPEEGRKEFASFCPEVVELLSHVDKAIKWTLAELPHLETFHSENGRVVLIGDAAHAMFPHTASGGNSAIEDAACLAECLDWAARGDHDVASATQAYEDLRKARVERMQVAGHEGWAFLGATGDFMRMRNQMMREQAKQQEDYLALPEETRRAMAAQVQPDMNARFPAPEYTQWLFGYDVIEETKKYLAGIA